MQISEDLRKRLTTTPTGVLCLRATRGDTVLFDLDNTSTYPLLHSKIISSK